MSQSDAYKFRVVVEGKPVRGTVTNDGYEAYQKARLTAAEPGVETVVQRNSWGAGYKPVRVFQSDGKFVEVK